MNYKFVAMTLALSCVSLSANATFINHNGGSCGGGGYDQPECTTEWSDSWTGDKKLVANTFSSSWTYVFDITKDGFTVGEDKVNDYSLSFTFADDEADKYFFFWESGTEYASLFEAGSFVTTWEVDSGDKAFGSTVKGELSLNVLGQLAVKLVATSGDFWLKGAELIACGVDYVTEVPPTTNVPEPTSIALLGLGLLGLGAARRKQRAA